MSDDKRRLDAKVTPNGAAEITLGLDDGSQGTITLDADRLLKLIQALGKVRAAMVSNLPPPSIEDAQTELTLSTQWRTDFDQLIEGHIFRYQDVRFGPVGLVISREGALRLISLLNKQIVANPPRTAADKPN